METERHSNSPWSNRGRSEPVVQKSQGTGSQGLEASTSSWRSTETECGAASAITELVATGSRSVRVSWTGLDHSASGPDDRARVWGEVSSSPLQPSASPAQV